MLHEPQTLERPFCISSRHTSNILMSAYINLRNVPHKTLLIARKTSYLYVLNAPHVPERYRLPDYVLNPYDD